MAGRQRPRRGGPDDGKSFAGNFGQAEGFGQSGIVFEQILHVDGGRYFVFIFHFGFGQRRTAIQTELNGFGAAVQITCFIDFAKCAHGVCLGFEIHGPIRLVPIAHHAQPHEVGFLAGDLFGGIFAAQFAEFVGRHIPAVQFFNHDFDGQAVAVPAGHIRRIETGQRFAADDDVFQDFIDGVTDMDVAVGIRRAVVQDEFRTAGGFFAQFLVAFLFLPLFDPAGFAFGEVAAHGERGFVQVDGFGIIGFIAHGLLCCAGCLQRLCPLKMVGNKCLPFYKRLTVVKRQCAEINRRGVP